MAAPPKIDTRNFETILQEIRQLVPFYTPELQVSDHQDSASALLKIFAQMMADTLQQLNQVPEKNFLAFLDLLGVKLLPSRQARAPVIFNLNKGTTQSVLIPAKTEVAAASSAGTRDSVVFETEKSILATPAKMVAIYSVNYREDSIFLATPDFVAGKGLTPFSARLVFEAKPNDTSLFLNNASEIKAGDILKIASSTKLLDFEYIEVNKISENKVALKDKLSFVHSIDTSVEKVLVLELFEGRNQQEHILYLGQKDIFNITGRVKIALDISGSPEKLADSQLVSWEYWGEVKETKTLGWHSFNKFGLVDKKLTLEKDNTDELQQTEINNIKSHWIRCIIVSLSVTENSTPSITSLQEVKLDSIKVTVTPLTNDETAAGFSPDMAFYNDVPIAITKDFYPFGREPHQQDPHQFPTFYFASQEAFSNKGVPLTLQFKIKQPEAGSSNEIEKPILSWEYWNGKSWNFLTFQGEPDKQILNLTKPEENIEQITFNCPEDIEQTSVNGEQQYWLRIRLVEGDYGREVPKQPHLENFTISYASLGGPLDYCLTFNNLQYQDKTAESQTVGKPFQPFQPLEDQHQAMYLGFDTPPLNGPISIFFSLEIQMYTEKNKPYLNWEYYRQPNGIGEWTRLEVRDGTFSLTQSGTLEFFGSPDFAQTSHFGKSLYWIRVTDVGDKFKPQERTYKRAIAHDPTTFSPEQMQQFYQLFLSNQAFKFEPTPEQVKFFHPEFLLAQVNDFAPAPRIKGIYLNTTWVVQARMIKNEILGSSNGTANQTFQFVRFPVISEEVWVNELSILASNDRKDLLAQADQGKLQVKEVKDNQGNTKEFWIKWEPLEELLESTSLDRHYEIDRTFGQIKFGNGTEGAIPPIGVKNIRTNYLVGGGSQGNVSRNQITSLRTSIAYVNNVSNPEAAGGGSDNELLEQVLERGPQMLKHRNRAVTKEDFEQLTYQADRSIHRVKCLPNFNNEGKYQLGWVTMIVVPKSSEAQPQPTLLLRQQIEKYLRDHAAIVVTSPKHLQVSGPTYIEIAIKTTLVATDPEIIPFVKEDAMQQLSAFLHPLTGYYDSQGWEFGKLPSLSDFYALLGSIPNLDHVESLSMNVRDTNTDLSLDLTSDRPLDLNIPAYTLVSSAKHQVDVKAIEN